MEDMYPITMEPGCILVHTNKGDIHFKRKDRLYCYMPKQGFFDHVERINNCNNQIIRTGNQTMNTGGSMPNTGSQNGGTRPSMSDTGSTNSGHTRQGETSTGTNPDNQLID